jgi:beta-glucosidase
MFDRQIQRLIHHILTHGKSMYKQLPQTDETDEHRPSGQRAEELLDQMSLEEKISYVSGHDDLAVRALVRLGIKEVYASDASSGIRCFPPASSFPALIGMAATWNRELMGLVGETIAEEARAKGVSMLLGPGVNIIRVPTGGRNFEYLSEDPCLAGELAASYIRGVQKRGVIAVVKHLACNNSEYDRHKSNSCVDERTLHEIYLEPFRKAIIRGRSSGVMTAYNQVNGVYASEHVYLLQRILREKWGYEGIIMSDWNSLYSTEGPVTAGLDLEMPGAKWLTHSRIQKALNLDLIRERDIDAMAYHLLHTFISNGILDRPRVDQSAQVLTENHASVVRATADEAMVLLKNDGNLLPIHQKEIHHIIIVGNNGLETATGGGGSSYMPPADPPPSIYSSMRRAFEHARVEYLATSRGRIHAKDRDSVQQADLVIAAVGFDAVTESECFDRSWSLPYCGDQLIQQISRLNDRVAVLLHGGGAVDCSSWIDNVPVLIHMFYLGSQAGDAAARIITGEVNPSGKLPVTMARHYEDYQSVRGYYKKPEKMSMLRIFGPQGNPDIRRVHDLHYTEGLKVGYRQFDEDEIQPLFPFGFGLSYTQFTCEGIQTGLHDGCIKATCQITNTGESSGAEVIQMYAAAVNPPVFRPKKELKGFEKIWLDPGETREISITCAVEQLGRYDEKIHDWVLDAGEYSIMLATHSRDIFFSETVFIAG